MKHRSGYCNDCMKLRKTFERDCGKRLCYICYKCSEARDRMDEVENLDRFDKSQLKTLIEGLVASLESIAYDGDTLANTELDEFRETLRGM